MKRIFVLLTGLALVASLQALDVTGISGRVTNAHNGHPIVGAAVCTGHGGAYTDSTGHYLIQIQPGTYEVHASAAGFQTEVYPESVVVIQDHVTDSINFALEPLGTQNGGISGRVTDAETEEPIAGALIVASGPSGNGEAHSYACGGYQIADLSPGKYQVCASATGYEPATYPESVVVVEGEVTPDIDFALEPEGNETGGISGFVKNASNDEPIPGALVTATGPHGSGQAYTCQQGGYLIENLPAGKYRVCAQALGFKSKVYPESVLVVGGQVTDSINFALEPDSGQTGGISGFVTNAHNGEPIPGALVVASGPHGSGQAHTCQQGGYLIAHLPAGKYRVCAHAQGFESKVYPESVLVTGGQITDSVNFALEPMGGGYGAISGRVTNKTNGKPIFGALVVAEGPKRGQANTCMQGNYYIGELPPGTYHVVASARGFKTSPPETVEVDSGHVTQHVDFALEPEEGETGGISGTVTDSATGEPIEGANLFAWGPHGQGQAVTDSTGFYLIEQLRAGKYLVRACAQGYYHKVYPESVHVQPGQTTEDIDFALAPAQACGISGFVYEGVSQTEVSGVLVTATGSKGTGQAYTTTWGEYLIEGLETGEYTLTVSAPGYQDGSYFEPVLVGANVVASLVSPPIYSLTGIQTSPEPRAADRLSVVPSVFGHSTTVRWQMPEAGWAVLRVFDRTGRAVRTLVNSRLSPGSCSVVWDGTDDGGSRLARGAYFLELRWPRGELTTRVLLID